MELLLDPTGRLLRHCFKYVTVPLAVTGWSSPIALYNLQVIWVLASLENSNPIHNEFLVQNGAHKSPVTAPPMVTTRTVPSVAGACPHLIWYPEAHLSSDAGQPSERFVSAGVQFGVVYFGQACADGLAETVGSTVSEASELLEFTVLLRVGVLEERETSSETEDEM